MKESNIENLLTTDYIYIKYYDDMEILVHDNDIVYKNDIIMTNNKKNIYSSVSGKILGLTETHNIIIIGAGNLGQAIANYGRFDRLGFLTIALFDVNPNIVGKKIRGIPIYSLDELDSFCEKNKVDIAALTLPKGNAENTAKRLVNLGIHAIWNFAHVDLKVQDVNVVVENVHLSDSLMQLSYNIAKNKK